MKLLSYSPENDATNFPTTNSSLSFTFNLPLDTDLDEDNMESIGDFYQENFNMDIIPDRRALFNRTPEEVDMFHYL